jgi:serine-type D-Ala-D-Ala carboxypeptidase (penicillin-binding protein 5/6)
MSFPALLLIILAPLNVLLPLNKVDFVEQKKIKNPIVKVEGAEKAKSEDIAASKNSFPVASFIPIKKQGIAELAIPNAHSSLILDVESGTILLNNNGMEKRQIASLTKMMTAVLVMEKVENLGEDVVIDEKAPYVDGTRIGCPRSGYCTSLRLKAGEKISVKNLLKAMLMNSANDAAYSLGKHIGGSEERFVEMMNAKAKEMDLNNTHFCTASGLEKEGMESQCYSSAYDIARIASYAMKYKLIWDIMKLDDTTISSSDGTCEHSIFNTDQVKDMPNCIGGKTGFTPLAGRSLLLAASDSEGKNKIIAVLLDDPYRWQDIKTMVSWAFQSYDWK